jgi:hypothetical protein
VAARPHHTTCRSGPGRDGGGHIAIAIAIGIALPSVPPQPRLTSGA